MDTFVWQGKQVAPSDFKKYPVEAYEQFKYPPLPPRCFMTPPDVKERLLMFIRKGETNNATDIDGIHPEMIEFEPKSCAAILTAWWSAFGGLEIFPKWE